MINFFWNFLFRSKWRLWVFSQRLNVTFSTHCVILSHRNTSHFFILFELLFKFIISSLWLFVAFFIYVWILFLNIFTCNIVFIFTLLVIITHSCYFVILSLNFMSKVFRASLHEILFVKLSVDLKIWFWTNEFNISFLWSCKIQVNSTHLSSWFSIFLICCFYWNSWIFKYAEVIRFLLGSLKNMRWFQHKLASTLLIFIIEN